MKVLHIVPTYYPATRYGGPIYSVDGLCRSLAQRGHKVDVVTTTVDGKTDSYLEPEIEVERDGVTVRYFRACVSRRLYWSRRMGRFLKHHIRDYDIVHIHAVFLWPTWVGAWEARKNQVPYILAPRGMLVAELIREKSRLKKLVSITLFDKRAIKNASAIHFTSERESEDFAELGIDVLRSVIVPNGVDVSVVPFEQNNVHDPKKKTGGYILYLGRVNWKKGIDRLIGAMQWLQDARLLVVGNDEEQYQPILQTLASQLGVEERINFMAPVHSEDKWRLLAEASVLVLPSRSENFGNVVLEAMSVGVPVVLTLEVGLAEAVKTAGAGLVSDAAPEALAASIRQVLNHPERAQAMGAAGRKLVEAKFTWERVAEQMEQTYLDILNAEGPRNGQLSATQA